MRPWSIRSNIRVRRGSRNKRVSRGLTARESYFMMSRSREFQSTSSKTRIQAQWAGKSHSWPILPTTLGKSRFCSFNLQISGFNSRLWYIWTTNLSVLSPQKTNKKRRKRKVNRHKFAGKINIFCLQLLPLKAEKIRWAPTNSVVKGTLWS
jgi:hypothetical protein